MGTLTTMVVSLQRSQLLVPTLFLTGRLVWPLQCTVYSEYPTAPGSATTINTPNNGSVATAITTTGPYIYPNGETGTRAHVTRKVLCVSSRAHIWMNIYEYLWYEYLW